MLDERGLDKDLIDPNAARRPSAGAVTSVIPAADLALPSERAIPPPQVQVLDAQGQPTQTVELTNAGLTVGRLPANNLVLNANTVSRNHLRIDWDGQWVTVT